jgi:hypothetical protein
MLQTIPGNLDIPNHELIVPSRQRRRTGKQSEGIPTTTDRSSQMTIGATKVKRCLSTATRPGVFTFGVVSSTQFFHHPPIVLGQQRIATKHQGQFLLTIIIADPALGARACLHGVRKYGSKRSDRGQRRFAYRQTSCRTRFNVMIGDPSLQAIPLVQSYGPTSLPYELFITLEIRGADAPFTSAPSRTCRIRLDYLMDPEARSVALDALQPGHLKFRHLRSVVWTALDIDLDLDSYELGITGVSFRVDGFPQYCFIAREAQWEPAIAFMRRVAVGGIPGLTFIFRRRGLLGPAAPHPHSRPDDGARGRPYVMQGSPLGPEIEPCSYLRLGLAEKITRETTTRVAWSVQDHGRGSTTWGMVGGGGYQGWSASGRSHRESQLPLERYV